MTNRGPMMVFLLTIVTFGLYALYWMVVTKNEMNARGAQIPTAWLIIIPFVNWYWLFKFYGGIGYVTNRQMSGLSAFLLVAFLGPIGLAIVQNALNKVA